MTDDTLFHSTDWGIGRAMDDALTAAIRANKKAPVAWYAGQTEVTRSWQWVQDEDGHDTGDYIMRYEAVVGERKAAVVLRSSIRFRLLMQKQMMREKASELVDFIVKEGLPA